MGQRSDVDSTSVTSVESGSRPWVLAALIGFLVLVGVAVSIGGSADEPDASPEPSTPTTAFRGFVRWPLPPDDHDPIVTGRPGAQEAVDESLRGVSLLYVNDHLRATVVDLTTGDRRELSVASTRGLDVFLLEGGQIVAETDNTGLPETRGRAFQIAIVTDGSVEPRLVAGPVLCATGDGCPNAAWTSGRFGDDERFVESLRSPGDPLRLIADFVGAATWTADGRFTIFELDDDELRVPTPDADTAVWRAVEPPPAAP